MNRQGAKNAKGRKGYPQITQMDADEGTTALAANDRSQWHHRFTRA
jgi:hypothetical protein